MNEGCSELTYTHDAAVARRTFSRAVLMHATSADHVLGSTSNPRARSSAICEAIPRQRLGVSRYDCGPRRGSYRSRSTLQQISVSTVERVIWKLSRATNTYLWNPGPLQRRGVKVPINPGSWRDSDHSARSREIVAHVKRKTRRRDSFAGYVDEIGCWRTGRQLPGGNLSKKGRRIGLLEQSLPLTVQR